MTMSQTEFRRMLVELIALTIGSIFLTGAMVINALDGDILTQGVLFLGVAVFASIAQSIKKDGINRRLWKTVTGKDLSPEAAS